METQQQACVHALEKIHPRSVKGSFRFFKTSILVLAYLTFFILPWIPWSRSVGESQAIMFDMTTRKFYIFDFVIHAQEIFWLAGLLLVAATLLFFATAVAGRLFCGYFCFQTLWTDAYRLIEQWIQGDRVKRIRLDKQSWNLEKIAKKGLTHFIWLLLALITGLSFIFYWGYAPQILSDVFSGSAATIAYATIIILTLTTYFSAGYLRESVCMHICPYARFQSVMIDKDTKVIAYDVARGEGQSGRVKPIKELQNQEFREKQGHGDCIDCGYCVQVCPTGIDIRDGLQFACIQCGLCIDACNTMMDKFNWKHGLIRYVSDNELEKTTTKGVKLRTYGYGFAVIVSFLFTLWMIMGSVAIKASVEQSRSPLYIRLSDGRIENRYTIKVVNNSQKPVRYELSIKGLNGQAEINMGDLKDFYIKPDGVRRIMVRVRLHHQNKSIKSMPFKFILTPEKDSKNELIIKNANFITP